MNIFLVFFVIYIVTGIWKEQKYEVLLNPLVLSLIVNFLLFGGGITNFFLYKEDFSLSADITSSIYFDKGYYVKAGLINSIALVGTVLGYYSFNGLKFRNFTTNLFIKYNNYSLKPNTLFLLVLVFLGYYIKIILMEYGLYGRLLNPEYTTIGANKSFLASQLSPLSSFSLFPFVIICYHYFKNKNYKALFFITLSLEFIFAFLEGARGPVMAVFIIVLIIKFYATKEINWIWFGYGILVLIFAFTITNGFKNYVLNGGITKGSPIELLSGFFSENTQTIPNSELEESIFTRMNYVNEMSAAIAYKDEQGLRENDPPFVSELISVPLNIIVPRSVRGVPKINWGDWFRYYVLNRGSWDTTYSIAFSPMAYFYFSGGTLAVIFGFFFYGILLRSLENLPKLGFVGFLLFVLIGSTIFQFKTAVPDILVSYFRLIIFIPLILKFFPNFIFGLKKE